MADGMYRIGVVGAASLKGKELADELQDSLLAASDFVLFDDAAQSARAAVFVLAGDRAARRPGREHDDRSQYSRSLHDFPQGSIRSLRRGPPPTGTHGVRRRMCAPRNCLGEVRHHRAARCRPNHD